MTSTEIKDMSEFSNKTREWLLSVIRQRKLLMKNGRSKVNEQAAREAIRDLELYLGAYSYANPYHMARFINGHKSQIQAILPGEGSPSHEKRHKEFEAYCRIAATLIQGKQLTISHAYSN